MFWIVVHEQSMSIRKFPSNISLFRRTFLMSLHYTQTHIILKIATPHSSFKSTKGDKPFREIPPNKWIFTLLAYHQLPSKNGKFPLFLKPVILITTEHSTKTAINIKFYTILGRNVRWNKKNTNKIIIYFYLYF